jgi:hypothetical protein
LIYAFFNFKDPPYPHNYITIVGEVWQKNLRNEIYKIFKNNHKRRFSFNFKSLTHVILLHKKKRFKYDSSWVDSYQVRLIERGWFIKGSIHSGLTHRRTILTEDWNLDIFVLWSINSAMNRLCDDSTRDESTRDELYLTSKKHF